MTDDFESWWELNGCREVYATQKEAAQAAWERARQKYSHAQLPDVIAEIVKSRREFNEAYNCG